MAAVEKKTPYVTTDQLGQVADAVKTYADNIKSNAEGACPEPADSSAITAIVNKFSVAD